jgi:hypothetical protein
MIQVSKIPKGIWAAFIYEMKKYKTFRNGYHQGQLNYLQSTYLTSDSSYRHKFGVLIACYEAGRITDVVLDHHTLSIFAYRNQEVIYQFTEKKETSSHVQRNVRF